MRAGLEISWFTNIWIFSVIAISIFRFKQILNIKKNLFFYLVFSYTIIFAISVENKIFDSINLEKISNFNLDNYFLNEKEISQKIIISEGLKKTLLRVHSDPIKSLSFFLHFKNLYKDKFSSNNNGYILLEDINSKIENSISFYLPTTPLNHSKIWPNFIFFISQILVGLVTYSSFSSKASIRKFLIYIAVSGVLLSVIGIIQKTNYIPSENQKEIFGIWDTPEPRYFFSSFTYKNHWSSYIILIISVLLSLLSRKFLLFRNKFSMIIFLFFLLGLFITILTLPHSGSRSGCVILILVLLFTSLNLLRNKYFKYHKQKILTVLTTSIIVFIIGFFLSSKTTKEMLTNTISVIEKKGAPLRIMLWKDLCRQISSKTFWGYGYDSYRQINSIFQSRIVREERAIGLINAHKPYTPLVAHGHCDLLEWISEFGWIGFIILPLPCILLILRMIFFSNSVLSQTIAIGTLCFVIYCCVDFPTRTPACLVQFSVILGLASKYSKLKITE